MSSVADLACPNDHCRNPDAGTRVVDTRGELKKRRIRRRRQCMGCGQRWTTYEYPEDVTVTKAQLKGVVTQIERLLLKVKHGVLA